jgi:hypothetical protein
MGVMQRHGGLVLGRRGAGAAQEEVEQPVVGGVVFGAPLRPTNFATALLAGGLSSRVQTSPGGPRRPPCTRGPSPSPSSISSHALAAPSSLTPEKPAPFGRSSAIGPSAFSPVPFRRGLWGSQRQSRTSPSLSPTSALSANSLPRSGVAVSSGRPARVAGIVAERLPRARVETTDDKVKVAILKSRPVIPNA